MVASVKSVLAVAALVACVASVASATSLVTATYANTDCTGSILSATRTPGDVCLNLATGNSIRWSCSGSTFTSAAYVGAGCTGISVQVSAPLLTCALGIKTVCDGSLDTTLSTTSVAHTTTFFGSVCTVDPILTSYQVAPCSGLLGYNCSSSGYTTKTYLSTGCSTSPLTTTTTNVNTCSGIGLISTITKCGSATAVHAPVLIVSALAFALAAIMTVLGM